MLIPDWLAQEKNGDVENGILPMTGEVKSCRRGYGINFEIIKKRVRQCGSELEVRNI